MPDRSGLTKVADRPWQTSPSAPECICMMRDVISNERRYEKIAVIVTRMQAQCEWMFGLQTSVLQQFGLELGNEEIIVLPLVDKYVQLFLRFGDERASVILFPVGLVAADV